MKDYVDIKCIEIPKKNQKFSKMIRNIVGWKIHGVIEVHETAVKEVKEQMKLHI